MVSKHSVLDHVYLTDMFVNLFIPISSAAGILFAIWLWVRVSAIKVRPTDSTQRTENGREYLLEEESRGEAEVRTHWARLSLRDHRCQPCDASSRAASHSADPWPPLGAQMIQHRRWPCYTC